MRLKRVNNTDMFEIWDNVTIKDFEGNNVVQERRILLTSLDEVQKQIDRATAEKTKWTRIKLFIQNNSN